MEGGVERDETGNLQTSCIFAFSVGDVRAVPNPKNATLIFAYRLQMTRERLYRLHMLWNNNNIRFAVFGNSPSTHL